MSAHVLFVSVLGFLSGILCRSFLSIGIPGAFFVLLLVTVCACAYLFHRRHAYLLAGIFFLAVLLGGVRTALVPMEPSPSVKEALGTEVTLNGVVTQDPDVRESSQRITLGQEDGTRVLVVAPRFPEVAYGDHITTRGLMVPPEAFDTDAGRVFRYDQYLAKDGVFAILKDAHVTIEEGRSGPVMHMFGALIDLKHLFMEGIQEALPEPHSSLAEGMLLGGKQGLGKELLDAFTVAGLVHIVVLSGYNIMIIAEAVLRTSRFLPKRTALTAAMLVIAGFVFAAGLSAAAVRAGIMALIALLARATGRTYDVLRALGVAVALMLLINPLLLAFDPGFQLSVLATLGLILGAPVIEKRLEWVRLTFLREIAAATIAAQVFVLPLLLYQTGSLSVVSLPANILVLPFVPFAMLLSFLASVVALLASPLAPIAGLPAYAVLEYILFMTQAFAGLPLAEVTVPAFSFVFVPVLYLGLLWYVFKESRSH